MIKVILTLLVLSSCNPMSFKQTDLNDIGSYYNPTKGTLNIHEGVQPIGNPKLSGARLPHDIIINEDLGRRVFRMKKDGSISWAHIEKLANLYDLKIYENHIGFTTNDEYVTLNINTGLELSRTVVNKAVGYRCYDTIIACERNGVRILATGKLIPAVDPRHAAIRNNIIYISNTWGHYVFAYDLIKDEKIWETDSYYPNSLELMSDTEIIVTEEHANRVVAFNIYTGTKRLIYGCNIGLYQDINMPALEFAAIEGTGIFNKPDGKGVCAGGRNLYSPNGATFTGDGYLISDTDNHRVLYIIDDKIVSIISNMNNPNSAYFIK